ncbi:unnamed protein product [Trichobilharzia regenti]|nr:unnamed protein product [Trichobilharzia regenti]
MERRAPSSCESFFRLLDNLNVDVIIQLFVQLLTEQKILMSSVRHSVLSDIGEALTCRCSSSTNSTCLDFSFLREILHVPVCNSYSV